MLHVKVINPIATEKIYSSVHVWCMHCAQEHFHYRRPGESLGKSLDDHCRKCDGLLPTLDYLISDTSRTNNTQIRAMLHGGTIV